MGQVVQRQGKRIRGDVWAGPWNSSECGWCAIAWTVELCAQPESSQDDIFGFFLCHMVLDAIQAFREGTVPGFLG